MRLRTWQFRFSFLPAALTGLIALVANPVAGALPVKAELVVSAAANAVDIVYAGDGAAQIYVVDQAGRVRILRGGALLPTPFLDIRSLVTFSGEQGLLGLAFHPGYATNGKFYVNYTRAGDGATVVASYRVSADRDRADPASGIELLTIAQPYANHNGGAVRFGPDGYLYIGMGDGGSGGDPENRAQNPQELLGKMLRIDIDAGTPYAIPAGNPFAGGGGRKEIFASGVRNPWRFSFDRGTGDLYIGDVGQGAVEEIDFLPKGQGAGANFGWRVVEGDECTNYGGAGLPCNSAAFTAPVLTYDHDKGCSVTGGVVYRGRKVPVLQGRYLYSDYCSGTLWAAARDRNGAWQTEVILQTGHHVGTIGEDVDGEVYWTDLTGGSIYRVVADTSVAIAVEYFNATLGHYFLTAFPEEAAALDGGAFAGAWQRTGYAFVVANSTDGDAVPVCRLFGTPGVGPNSHFYTGYPQECAGLKANPLWTYEGIGFLIRVAVNDGCPSTLRPVYRLYNNPATLAQVNHRFTADGATYNAMRAAGWIGEGVAFCAK